MVSPWRRAKNRSICYALALWQAYAANLAHQATRTLSGTMTKIGFVENTNFDGTKLKSTATAKDQNIDSRIQQDCNRTQCPLNLSRE